MQGCAGVGIDAKLAVFREKARCSGTSSLRHPQRFIYVIISVSRCSSKHHKNVVNLATQIYEQILRSLAALNLHGTEPVCRVVLPSDKYFTNSLGGCAKYTAGGIDGSGTTCMVV